MLNLLAIPTAAMPFVIFFLRVGDMSLDTLRVLFVIRGRKPIAWILGFFQSALWVIAITSVLNNLGNLWNVIGYAGGFATGNVVGMVIEEWLAVGHGHMRIMSSRRGTAIAEAIRQAGYAATELSGRGRDGMVSVINCSVRRRDIDRVRAEVMRIDPEAFLTVEEVRPLQRGFWRA
ncbi:MAG TPA: DUF5698 domain-containing protein [Anaerolineales bacterium]|jgi:uncharacterized protein YebE (UPF0316 family)|nr:DUF5698 domain-containing protein [Anaerolineales bacterium]